MCDKAGIGGGGKHCDDNDARQKVESEERSMVLTILRTNGVVTLIAEDKVGGIRRYYYRKSVVLPTKTLNAKNHKPGSITNRFLAGGTYCGFAI